jgi:hypothetical protein
MLNAINEAEWEKAFEIEALLTPPQREAILVLGDGWFLRRKATMDWVISGQTFDAILDKGVITEMDEDGPLYGITSLGLKIKELLTL